MLSTRRIHSRSGADGDEVSHIELYFDLVFVFAITQITATMAHSLTWHSVLQGVLLLGLLWWSWVGYSWIGNVIRPDDLVSRIALFAAMAIMFIAALTIPEAFDDLPGGLPGPVVISLCYFAFRVIHLTLFWSLSRNNADEVLRNQLLRFTPAMLGGTTTLLVASMFDGWEQTVLWALALIVDYAGTYLGGASGWRLPSAKHFAERHALILIIALGESFIAIGVAVAELPISTPIVTGSLLAFLLSASLWWAYFDKAMHVGADALAAVPEHDRARIGRDAYSYLHLPIVGGVVLLALGVKKALEYIGDSAHHSLSDHLSTIPVISLYGGLTLYLLAGMAFTRRLTNSTSLIRLAGIFVIILTIPIAMNVPAMVALGVASLLAVAVVVLESLNERRSSNA